MLAARFVSFPPLVTVSAHLPVNSRVFLRPEKETENLPVRNKSILTGFFQSNNLPPHLRNQVERKRTNQGNIRIVLRVENWYFHNQPIKLQIDKDVTFVI